MIAVEKNFLIRRRTLFRCTRTLIPILLLVGGAVLPFDVASADSPKEVLSEADLPRLTYPVTGAVSSLLEADDATFAPFVQKAVADIQSILTNYSIKDHAALISVMSAKLAAQELNGETADALKTIATLRDLQQKPDLKLTVGLFDEAILKARQQTNATSGSRYEAAIESAYKEAVTPLPWDIVQDAVKSARSVSDLLTSTFVIGRAEEDLQPEVDRSGALDLQGFFRLLNYRATVRVKLPVNAIRPRVLSAYIAAHDTVKPDIWQARDVTLSAADHPSEVRIGIFDSGVDSSLYTGQFHVVPHSEPFPSQGLAFTDDGRPSDTTLAPLTQDQSKQYASVEDDLEALSDLQAGIDSPAGEAFKQRLPQLSKSDVEGVFKQLDFFGNFAHGTHVAGIAVRGNPAARVVVFRFNDNLSRGLNFPPTVAWVERMAANFKRIADYCRTENVRVVNMSWGDDPHEFEEWLAHTKSGQTGDQRKAEAASLYRIWRQAIIDTINGAPNTLWVTAAGNSDSDAGFLEDVPASLELPNLITVGATNQAGDPTTFTSYGKTVVIYADGFQVESYIPGGRRVMLSGTSMASPAVANLAAKLFAVDPKLTPKQARKLILDGADSSEDGRRKLMNEKRSIEFARLNKEKAAGFSGF
jgi:subtilisin family serine protease